MPSIIAGESIASKDKVAIKAFFSKLKKEELIELWTSWGLEPTEGNESKKACCSIMWVPILQME